MNRNHFVLWKKMGHKTIIHRTSAWNSVIAYAIIAYATKLPSRHRSLKRKRYVGKISTLFPMQGIIAMCRSLQLFHPEVPFSKLSGCSFEHSTVISSSWRPGFSNTPYIFWAVKPSVKPAFVNLLGITFTGATIFSKLRLLAPFARCTCS